MVTRAKRRGSVARVCRLTPLFAQGQHYVFYLSSAPQGEVGQSHLSRIYICILIMYPDVHVSQILLKFSNVSQILKCIINADTAALAAASAAQLAARMKFACERVAERHSTKGLVHRLISAEKLRKL